ncbi:MAG: glycosyltransferase family 4 protein [Betaproteobacteria bacterium]|nr:glycosyltransferase family 4 protein [Betaproteobacteria bacterium]
MIYIDFPLGSVHGWGVCGKYCTRELARLTPTRMLAEQFTAEIVGDSFEWHELAQFLFPRERLAAFPRQGDVTRLDAPLLECIDDKQLLPASPKIRGTRTLGYSFFEHNVLKPDWIDNARRHFDWVATGSTWCTRLLKEHGLDKVSTVVQGVDHRVFFPRLNDREFFRDRFVVFSGGKFELRKAQDIVIRAYKVLQDRHDDVMLVNAWYNPWPYSVQTMLSTKLIHFNPPETSYVGFVNAVLADNGIDLNRVITLMSQPNLMMPRVYANADVGLFPNRCEGGTNLVLMEFMACGKPVVASNVTGHADVVNPDNALLVEAKHTTEIRDQAGEPIAVWPEPDLDQAIAQLEHAYQHRDELRSLGARAGRDLASWTWGRTAAEFLRLLTA